MNKLKKAKKVLKPLHISVTISRRRMNLPKVAMRTRLAVLLLAASVGPTALASAQDCLTPAPRGETLIVNSHAEAIKARHQQLELESQDHLHRSSRPLIVNFHDEAAKARCGQQILEVPVFSQSMNQMQP